MTRHSNPLLRDHYRMAHPADELAIYLGMDFTEQSMPKPMWLGLMLDAHDCHHIFSNPRRDLWSNLISLSRRAHVAFHDRMPRELRIACLLAKARKADKLGDPREFVPSEWDL